MTTYFGFGIADSMFPATCSISRKPLPLEEARAIIAAGVVSCLNPSHAPTVQAMKSRGLDVPIPASAPKVSLGSGDRIVILGVRGLPRLEGRHEYTQAEIDGATFALSVYDVRE